MNAFASSLTMLWIGAAVGGVGAGAVYGTCVGNALKWVPDRRGLAARLAAGGFGAGSARTGCARRLLVVPPPAHAVRARQGQPDAPRLHARRDGAHARLLDHVRDVRDGG